MCSSSAPIYAISSKRTARFVPPLFLKSSTALLRNVWPRKAHSSVKCFYGTTCTLREAIAPLKETVTMASPTANAVAVPLDVTNTTLAFELDHCGSGPEGGKPFVRSTDIEKFSL